MTIILDDEDIKRIEATTKWGGEGIKLDQNGEDLEILQANGRNAGYAYGIGQYNLKLKEILTSKEEPVQVLCWNKLRKSFVQLSIHPENGVLDLRQFVTED